MRALGLWTTWRQRDSPISVRKFRLPSIQSVEAPETHRVFCRCCTPIPPPKFQLWDSSLTIDRIGEATGDVLVVVVIIQLETPAATSPSLLAPWSANSSILGRTRSLRKSLCRSNHSFPANDATVWAVERSRWAVSRSFAHREQKKVNTSNYRVKISKFGI